MKHIYPLVLVNIIALATIFSINFTPFFYVKWEVNTINAVNDIFKNISYSTLAATVFYIIVDRLPYYKKKKKAEKVFNRQIGILYNTLQFIFLIIFNDKELEKFKETKEYLYNGLNHLHFNSKLFKVILKEEGKTFPIYFNNEYDAVITLVKSINENIDIILMNHLSEVLDTEMLSVLHEIRSSNLINDLENDYSLFKKSYCINIASGFNYSLVKYYLCFEKISEIDSYEKDIVKYVKR